MATIRSRVERLEGGARRGGVDVEAEAAVYGERLWETDSGRAYLSVDGATLTTVGPAGVVRYEVPGVSLRETV